MGFHYITCMDSIRWRGDLKDDFVLVLESAVSSPDKTSYAKGTTRPCTDVLHRQLLTHLRSSEVRECTHQTRKMHSPNTYYAVAVYSKRGH